MARTTRADQEDQRDVSAAEAAREQRQAMQEPAVDPLGPPASTVTQPAAPDQAGPGILHPDGSIAPAEDDEPIGTTRTVE